MLFGPPPPKSVLWPVSEVMVGQEEGVQGLGEASRGWLRWGGRVRRVSGGLAPEQGWLCGTTWMAAVFTEIVLGVPRCKAMLVLSLERRWEHLPSHGRSNRVKLFGESRDGEGIFVQKRHLHPGETPSLHWSLVGLDHHQVALLQVVVF